MQYGFAAAGALWQMAQLPKSAGVAPAVPPPPPGLERGRDHAGLYSMPAGMRGNGSPRAPGGGPQAIANPIGIAPFSPGVAKKKARASRYGPRVPILATEGAGGGGAANYNEFAPTHTAAGV